MAFNFNQHPDRCPKQFLKDAIVEPAHHEFSNERMGMLYYPENTKIGSNRLFCIGECKFNNDKELDENDEIIKYYQGDMGNGDIGYFRSGKCYIIKPPWDVGDIYATTDKKNADIVFNLYHQIQEAHSHYSIIRRIRQNYSINKVTVKSIEKIKKEEKKFEKIWGIINCANKRELKRMGVLK